MRPGGVLCSMTGGALDIVALCDDIPSPNFDVGLLDHRLLRWSTPLQRELPVYNVVTRPSWSRLDPALLSSSLCSPDAWTELNIDEMAALYDSEITGIMDRLCTVHPLP